MVSSDGSQCVPEKPSRWIRLEIRVPEDELGTHENPENLEWSEGL